MDKIGAKLARGRVVDIGDLCNDSIFVKLKLRQGVVIFLARLVGSTGAGEGLYDRGYSQF